jgi:hypothetical protein
MLQGPSANVRSARSGEHSHKQSYAMKNLFSSPTTPFSTLLLCFMLALSVPGWANAPFPPLANNDPVVEAEKKVMDALDKLNEEIARIREAIKRNPKYHETFQELKNRREALKKAADELDVARIDQDLKAKKALDKIKDEEKKKKAERDMEREDKVRKALEDLADKARKVAEAKDNDAKDYDTAKKALDDAKKALDKIRDVNKAERAVEKAEEDLKKEREKRNPNARKLAELERAVKEAKEKLEEVKNKPISRPDQGASAEKSETYFVFGLGAALPLGKPDAQIIDRAVLQEAVFSPDAMPALFEALQGEYFIGTLSGETTPSYQMTGSSRILPGLRMGLGFGRRFEARAGVQLFRNEQTGSFPVTVFPFGSSAPRTVNGRLSSTVSGFIAEADAVCFLGKGSFKPYLSLGARGIFPTRNSFSAEVEGIALPVEPSPVGNSYSVFGGAGVRLGLLGNGYVDLGANYGRMHSSGFLPALAVSFGWKFGGGNKRLANAQVNAKKSCACDNIYATITIRNNTRKAAIEAEKKHWEDKAKDLKDQVDRENDPKAKDQLAKELNGAQESIQKLQKRLDSKVYEEKREVSQDIVSEIAESGDIVEIKVEVTNVKSKTCHCEAAREKEPDCAFNVHYVFDDNVNFKRKTNPDEKNEVYWERSFKISEKDPFVAFYISGICSKPAACEPSIEKTKRFLVTFAKN